jgi:hypothetical protein
MDDIRRTLDLIAENSAKKRKPANVDATRTSVDVRVASAPKTSLPGSYYLAAAANLWVAVRFGLGSNLNRGGGDRGSIFDWFMDTTAKSNGIVVGISKNARDNGKSYKEHIVPCKKIVDKAIDIYQEGATPGKLLDDREEFKRIKEVARLIKNNLFVVKITPEEANTIDQKLGLQTRMPSGWQWGDDVFARIGAVGKAYGKKYAIPVYDISNQQTLIYGPTGKDK